MIDNYMKHGKKTGSHRNVVSQKNASDGQNEYVLGLAGKERKLM